MLERNQLCQKCGTENLSDSTYCHNCGSRLDSKGVLSTGQSTSICLKCNAEKIVKDAVFCHECGSPYPKSIETQNPSQGSIFKTREEYEKFKQQKIQENELKQGLKYRASAKATSTAPSVVTTQKCTHCAKDTQINQAKCQHCGYFIESIAETQTSYSNASSSTTRSVTIKNPRNGASKEINVGWSWTCFLFSPFFGIPLFMRELNVWGGIMAGLWVINFIFYPQYGGLALLPINLSLAGLGIYFGIKGNELTAKNYLEKGWVFANPDSEAVKFAKRTWGLGATSITIDDSKRRSSMSSSSDAVGTLAILSLVFGALSVFVLTILFAPAAIVCGVLAGTKGRKMGWWGMGIGIFGVVGMLALQIMAR